MTTPHRPPTLRAAPACRPPGVGIRTVAAGPGGVDVLAAGLVDRLVVSVSPIIIGTGVEAVRDLGTARITDGLRLRNRATYLTGDDVLLCWDVHARHGPSVTKM